VKEICASIQSVEEVTAVLPNLPYGSVYACSMHILILTVLPHSTFKFTAYDNVATQHLHVLQCMTAHDMYIESHIISKQGYI